MARTIVPSRRLTLAATLDLEVNRSLLMVSLAQAPPHILKTAGISSQDVVGGAGIRL
jgi:hypothetical protein